MNKIIFFYDLFALVFDFSLYARIHQVFNHYFCPDEYKNQSSKNFGVSVDLGAGLLAQQYAQHGCDEGNSSNDNYRNQDFFEHGGKTKANRKRIDTCSQRKHQDNFKVQWVFYLARFGTDKAFDDHFPANNSKQSECNPVVDGFDQ